MKEYDERDYRKRFDTGRLHFFSIKDKESDLFIGIDTGAFSPSVADYALDTLRRLRVSMEEYIARDPEYARALVPYFPSEGAPGIMFRMTEAASRAGIGPMGAVAGAVAEKVGSALKKEFGFREVIVENGGDIYASITEGLNIPVFAGESPLSEKVGISIPAGATTLGICTSAGTVGPSLSFGKADAVMIVCEDTALADSYATAFANRIQTAEDIDAVIATIKQIPEILGALCIKDDRLGICGNYELKIWNA